MFEFLFGPRHPSRGEVVLQLKFVNDRLDKLMTVLSDLQTAGVALNPAVDVVIASLAAKTVALDASILKEAADLASIVDLQGKVAAGANDSAQLLIVQGQLAEALAKLAAAVAPK